MSLSVGTTQRGTAGPQIANDEATIAAMAREIVAFARADKVWPTGEPVPHAQIRRQLQPIADRVPPNDVANFTGQSRFDAPGPVGVDGKTARPQHGAGDGDKDAAKKAADDAVPASDVLTIKAEVLRRVLTGDVEGLTVKEDGVSADSHEHHRKTDDELAPGLYSNATIFLKGVRIDGRLNCQGADIWAPLFCYDCVFSDTIDLEDASINTAFFANCDFHGGLLFARLTAHRSMGFSGCILDHGLRGDGLVIGRSLYFRGNSNRRLIAKKEVWLVGSRIEVQLACNEADFRADSAKEVLSSLVCDSMIVGQSVHLIGVMAQGAVSLNSAGIGGQLNCVGSSFHHDYPLTDKKHFALNCESIVIARHLFLAHTRPDKNGHTTNTNATGIVNISGAKIGGSLICRGIDLDCGTCPEEGTVALTIARATVEQNFLLQDLSLKGDVDLTGASVNELHDEEATWPIEANSDVNGRLHLGGFRYRALNPASQFDWKKRKQWLQCQPKSDLGKKFQPDAWTQLTRIYRNTGRDLDAREIAKDREKCRTKMYFSRGRRVAGFLRQSLGVFFGYGYDALRATGFCVFFMVVFAGLFWKFERDGVMVPSSNEALIYSAGLGEADAIVPPPGYAAFNPLIYSVDLFVPFVNLQQAERWQPRSYVDSAAPRPTVGEIRENPLRLLRFLDWLVHPKTIMWLEILFGWVFVTTTGLTFSGVLRQYE